MGVAFTRTEHLVCDALGPRHSLDGMEGEWDLVFILMELVSDTAEPQERGVNDVTEAPSLGGHGCCEQRWGVVSRGGEYERWGRRTEDELGGRRVSVCSAIFLRGSKHPPWLDRARWQ